MMKSTIFIHRFVLVASVSFLHIKNAFGAITMPVAPVDTAGSVGSRIKLDCSLDFGGANNIQLVWWEYISSSTGTQVFCESEAACPVDSSRYEIEGRHNLVIKSAKVAGVGERGDVGKYKCAPSLGTSPSEEVDVVLIDDCSTRTQYSAIEENTNMHLICEVTYYGRTDLDKHPVLSLYDGVTELPSVPTTQPSVTTTPSSQGGSYTIQVTGQVLVTASHSNKTFSCVVSYRTPLPVYTNQCSTTPVDVQYGPRNIHIKSSRVNGSTYYPGDIFQCSADSNPSPSFNWIRMNSSVHDETSDRVEGPMLGVTSRMNGYNIYSCDVENNVISDGVPVKRRDSKHITFFVNTSSKTFALNFREVLTICVIALKMIYSTL